jgi:glycosyltransferase involved in cell wall biosynthesis
LKRLLIASTDLPPVPGGAEQVAWETSKRLTGAYEVHILTVGTGKTELRENVKIHYIPPARPYTLAYSTILKPRIHTIFGEISPNILHSHFALPWGIALANAKCAKIITCHGSVAYSKKQLLRRFLVNHALCNADVVTAPSRRLANYIQQEYNVSCMVLPNGVDTDIFRPIEGSGARDNVILYVGRMLKRKGLSELFEAARALPEYEFWLVGGPRADIEVPSLPNLKVIGERFGNDLVACYNQASLCVFPSLGEIFPLVGLEAMACGRAVIATKPGFSEYMENGRDGLNIEPGSSNELIRSIRYLMENRSVRTGLERNAREKALHYDWRIIIKRYKELYERVQ